VLRLKSHPQLKGLVDDSQVQACTELASVHSVAYLVFAFIFDLCQLVNEQLYLQEDILAREVVEYD
jgi:hypothetical protein